jgi:outer membrane lipoprotein-sorting protein
MTGSFQVQSMVRVSVVAINHPPGVTLPGPRKFVWASLFLLFFSVIGAPGRSQDAPDGLARVEAFLTNLRSLRAHVDQRFHDRAHDREVSAEGELALSRPDRLTLRYSDGRGLAMLGTTVTAVDPDAALVHERSLRDDSYPELRALLAGAATLASTFDVRSLGVRTEGPMVGSEVLEVRPLSRALWDRALLSIGEDGVPQRVLVVDAAGNTLRWVLSRVRTSASLPPGALSLPLPDRADTISP